MEIKMVLYKRADKVIRMVITLRKEKEKNYLGFHQGY